MKDMDKYRVSGKRLRAAVSDKPTDKQIEYVEAISELLGIDPPVKETKKAYSKFIDKYSEEYRDTLLEISLTYEMSLEAIDARRDW